MLVNYGLFENDFKSLIPEIFLSSILLFLVAYSVIFNYNVKFQRNYILVRNITWLSVLTLFFTIVLYVNSIHTNFLALNFQYISNNFILYTKVIILCSIILTLLLGLDYFKREQIVEFESVLLILLSALGMIFLVSANDFITVYLALELISLSFYILAASKTYSTYSAEAGLKYFVLGALASCLFLYGLSFIYGAFGTTNFSQLTLIFNNQLWSDNVTLVYDLKYFLLYLLLPITLMATAFFFKIGAAPFHMWLPDVYEGSPTFITAFFSIVPKIAIFTIFYRIFYKVLYIQDSFFITFTLIIGVVSLVIGSLSALYQTKIKRLFAYSAITHTGFILLGFSSHISNGVSQNNVMPYNFNDLYLSLGLGDNLALQSILFYLVIYITLSINVFSIILSLRKWSDNIKIKNIGDLKSLLKANPLLSFVFALTLFSIAGVPPLLGFYGKLYVFYAMVAKSNYEQLNINNIEILNKWVGETGNFSEMAILLYNYKYYIVIVIALLMSVVSALYYIRLIRVMFFNSETNWNFMVPLDRIKSLIIAYTTLINIFFFMYPKPLFVFVNKITSEWFF